MFTLHQNNKNEWAPCKETWCTRCELKRQIQRWFYSCHISPPVQTLRVIGNHRRVLWRQILLFVNAEHSQEFIFIQCISRNHLLREFRVRAHSWPWRRINYTCSHVTWFKQTALLIKKTVLPWGKTQITFFITSFCLTTQGSLFALLSGGVTAVISACLPNPLHVYHFFPIVSGNIWNLTVVKHKIWGIRRFNSD